MSLVLPQLQLAQPERRERQELSPGRAASQALQAPLALWVSRVRLELLERRLPVPPALRLRAQRGAAQQV